MNHKRNGSYASDDDPQWDRRLSANAKGTPTYREKIDEFDRQRALARSIEQFVRLGHDMLGSPAWLALGPYGQAAYIRLAKRYRPARKDKRTGANKPTNNGKIPMAVRELAKEMCVHIDTAHKQLLRLEALGFIRPSIKGWFGSAHQATTWRLTEYGTNEVPLATRDYLDIEQVDIENIENSISRPKGPNGRSYRAGQSRPTKSNSAESVSPNPLEARASTKASCTIKADGCKVSRPTKPDTL